MYPLRTFYQPSIPASGSGGGGGGGGSNNYQGYFDPAGRNFPNNGIGVDGGSYWMIDPGGAGGNIKGSGAEPGIDVAPGAIIFAGVDEPGNDPLNWSINQ